MNYKFILFLPLVLACSSGSKNAPENHLAQEVQVTEIKQPLTGATSSSENEENVEPLVAPHVPTKDWDTYQDSLRKELIQLKSSHFLIGSLAEELYLRGAATTTNQELTFNLLLDLHGFDCGAPDCYTTELIFSFPHEHRLVFPKVLEYSIHEYGCVDTEIKTTGTMKLLESGDHFVNYYSAEEKSNLVIIGNDTRKEFVYYFTETTPDKIKAEALNELMDNWPEDDLPEPAPFRSTRMLKRDYQQFLGNI